MAGRTTVRLHKRAQLLILLSLFVGCRSAPDGGAEAVGSLATPTPPLRQVEPGFLPPDDPRLAGMIFIPSGPFLMGSTGAQIESLFQSYGGSRALYECEYPQRSVILEAFYIDRTEVAQQQYSAFVGATGREDPFVDTDWASLYNWKQGAYPEGLGDHPVVLVTYDDAKAYCQWAGKSLPAEAEWEKAARGTGGRQYPWGNEWEKSRLNSSTSWSEHELPTVKIWTKWWKDVYKVRLRGNIVTTKPVGSYLSGASPYGALDMAGNVFEWVEDWFDAYSGSTYDNPEFGKQYGVVRGGDWYLDRIYTRAPARLRSPADHKVPTIGFRCVCRDESALPAEEPLAR